MIKVSDVLEEIEGKPLGYIEDLNRALSGVCASDLLSYVMSHTDDNNAIITVLTNINVLAVATLVEASCVIIPSSIPINEQLNKKAEDEGILIISSKLTTYEICGKLYSLISKEIV